MLICGVGTAWYTGVSWSQQRKHREAGGSSSCLGLYFSCLSSALGEQRHHSKRHELSEPGTLLFCSQRVWSPLPASSVTWMCKAVC